jgi:hypothetical protein
MTKQHPYRELGKPFAIRTCELLSALQLLSDSIHKIRGGEMQYQIVLSGQLRSLLAEKSRGESPLLLEIAQILEKSLDVYCMPSTSDSDLPESIADNFLLHIAGFPVSVNRQLRRQAQVTISDFLDSNIICFNGVYYSPRKIIEWYANKAGGAHYSSTIPEVFSQLLSLNVMGIQPLANCLLQLGEVTLALGIRTIKSIVDMELCMRIYVPQPEHDKITATNYLFDSCYEGSSMRISLWLNEMLTPCFFVSGLQADWASIKFNQVIDWTESRLIHTSLHIEDDLSTTLRISVDGEQGGKINIRRPIFVLSDPLDYEACYNKAINGDPQNFTLAVSEVVMLGRELSPKDKANILLYMIEQGSDPGQKYLVYFPFSYGLSVKGSKDLSMHGKVELKSFDDISRCSSKSAA